MRRLRRLWQKALGEKRLDSELQFHLEQLIADYVASGISPEEARRRAQLEFGGVERFKEECREARWEHHLDILARDLRFAFRGLSKDRRFAFVAIFALALGIGASTAIFSVVDNALCEPFPYKDSRDLVTVFLRDLDQSDDGRGVFTMAEFQEFKKQDRVFDGMIANLQDDFVYSVGDSNLRLGGNYVTPGTAEFLGVPPFLGRNLEASDYLPGAPPVFVMRYVTWVSRFGADPSWIGKQFNLNGVFRTLVGVMAPRFAWGGTDLWMPTSFENAKQLRSGQFGPYWGIVARTKSGVSREESAAALNVVAHRLSTIDPKEYPKRFSAEVLSFGYAVVPRRFRSAVYIFCAAVGLLLLIGCGNVANLLLARATTREREFAVRSALGASRVRIVRQLLVESSLLALGGAALGVVFAWVGVKVIAAALPGYTIASETVIEMNGAVLVFALVVGVCTVFVFGLFPALQASRCDLNESLRETGKSLTGTGRVGTRSAVIVLEVALSVTLLFTAGLFMRSFAALQHVPLGLQTDHVLTARIPLPPERYKTREEITTFFRPFLARLKSTPGVAYAATTISLPLYGGPWMEVEVPGKSHSEKWHSVVELCSGDYFSVMRIPFRSGRMFTEGEVNGARHLAVINQTFWRRYFDNQNPIGRKILVNELKNFPDGAIDPSFEVVGVVADAQNRGLQQPVEPELWIPYNVAGGSIRGILLRTSGEPAAMFKALTSQIWATDPGVAMAEPNSLDELVNLYSFAQPRFGLWLVGIFAALGLVLATIGVYSVVAYSTTRRTHEIGLRMALGAAATDVLRMVFRQGLGWLLAGVVVGLVTTLALSRVIASQLWGVSPYDPVTAGSVVVLLLGVGLLACWVPARRATRVDPTAALRCE